MTETEIFKRINKHLSDGNFGGVRETFKPELMEKSIDDDHGRRPIHLACKIGDFQRVKLLIENNCNIETEDKNKRRPIHLACENGHKEIVKLLIENKCNIECETEGEWRPIHYACEKGHFETMKLLIDNKCNIECETEGGWKPIHLACEKGQFEILKLLIENKCNIESETKGGERPIHYGCKNGNFEIVKLIIENKCDIESETKRGWRPIHVACQNGHKEIVKLLIENKCYVESKTERGWRAIHYACEKGDLETVKMLIKNKCDIESEDKEGWRPIHYACQKGHFETVKLIIENKCDIESETKGGNRPIHLALQNDHKEIVKLLIFQNCFINDTDRDRKALLDWAKSKDHGEIVKLISELDKVTKQIKDSILKNDDKGFDKFYNSDLLTGLHWLEFAWENNADKIIDYFLNRPIDAAEISYMEEGSRYVVKQSAIANLWNEVLLYKCIKQHHEDGFKLLCKPSNINRPQKIIPCSFLELIAENGNSVLVEEILRKSIFDSDTWEKAKNIALQNDYHQIHNSISKRKYLLKSRLKINLSILHTAVCDNDPDMIEYLLSQGLVDPNENHEIFGTALAFAIQLCHRECLTVLKRFNISCNTQNKYLQSPLHEAISNGMIKDCQYLMDRVENIDQPGFMRQTALHCAVMRGCEELCTQLVEREADCNLYTKFCQTLTGKKGTPISNDPLSLSPWENSLTLCVKMNKTIYPCFLNSLDRDKANCCDDNGNSLLHLTARLLEPDLCNFLLQVGAHVDKENKKGNTPMFVLLSSLNEESLTSNEDKIIEIVNLFVQSGCDLNKSLKGDASLFNIISKFNCERLLLALLPRQQNQFFEIDENILKIALDKHFYRFCEDLINVFPKRIKSFISTNVIETALKQECPNLLKSLVINADDDVQQIVSEFSLYRLAKMDDNDSFECLFNIEVNNPLCFDNGETLLTRLLKEKKFDFCRQIIESKENSKKYINFKNEMNQTPLQVAIETESINIVQSLIFGNENIDNEDCEGRTALSQLFVKISDNDKKDQHLEFLNAIKAIIYVGGDIYRQNSQRVKAIEYCSSVKVRNTIETFFKNKQERKDKIIIEKEKVVVVKEIESEKRICGVCLDREVDSVFECGHTICQTCSDKIVRCPFCNLEPVHAKRIYYN